MKTFPFRARFCVDEREAAYVKEHGEASTRAFAEGIIRRRLAPAAYSHRDGKQTPMKGHAVFKAQHACALCCRGCMQKFYGIDPKRPLTEAEIKAAVGLIMAWIHASCTSPKQKLRPSRKAGPQLELF